MIYIQYEHPEKGQPAKVVLFFHNASCTTLLETKTTTKTFKKILMKFSDHFNIFFKKKGRNIVVYYEFDYFYPRKLREKQDYNIKLITWK